MNAQVIQGPAHMSIIGWVLVAVGAIGLLASVVGIAFVCFQQPASALTDSATELYLHDTYYVISRPLYTVWPLILCVVLSAAISVVGYMHTEHFTRRIISTTGKPPTWTSYPNDA
jgi:hypothetical protein